jgi:hypothetical protein
VKKPKTTKVIVTAELEIENDLIYDKFSLLKDLDGEFIKIKSGAYDNIACGYVKIASLV